MTTLSRSRRVSHTRPATPEPLSESVCRSILAAEPPGDEPAFPFCRPDRASTRRSKVRILVSTGCSLDALGWSMRPDACLDRCVGYAPGSVQLTMDCLHP